MNKIFNLLKNNSVYLKYNQNRYNQILKSLKVKKKISVIFLTNHISQWKYQSLFEIFIDLGEKKEPKKNPIIAPGSLNKVYPKIANSHLFILKV